MLSQPVQFPVPAVRLLVSVRNAAEAAMALRGGISILDVKAPERGPLGQPTNENLQQVAAVEPANPIDRSVACGELTDYMTDEQDRPHIPDNFTYFKLGLSALSQTSHWPDFWEQQIRRFPNLKPVAVAYADYELCGAPHPEEIMQAGKQLGCQFFLFDTFSKTEKKNIFSYLSQPTLSRWIQQAKNLEMKTVIAGSITHRDVKRCVEMAPDYIGVRRAVCRSGRESGLDRDKLSQLVERLCECHRRRGLVETP